MTGAGFAFAQSKAASTYRRMSFSIYLTMAVQHTKGFWPVIAATLGGNCFVTVIAKISFAASVSGSSSMFSEAVHSTADTVNQILLLIGLGRSTKKADESFEYGYRQRAFFLGAHLRLLRAFRRRGRDGLQSVSPHCAIRTILNFPRSCSPFSFSLLLVEGYIVFTCGA